VMLLVPLGVLSIRNAGWWRWCDVTFFTR